MKKVALPLTLDLDQEPGSLLAVSPTVRRIIAPNAGPMTFKGTCTYVVGHGEVAVIDPGPALPGHIDSLLSALGPERVAHILVTHTHRDHSPAARLLKNATQAPIVGCGPYSPARPPHGPEIEAAANANDFDYAPDRILAHGESVAGQGYTLTALATPGHTMNHLAFALAEENALFSGDHVMAWSTTIVAPPTGSMGAYMASLELLRGRGETIYWPGHGGPVNEPQRFVRALQHHRRQRELAIITQLRRGATDAETIVGAIYENLEPRLRRAAAYSILAHLEHLLERGRALRDGDPGLAAQFRIA